MNSEDLDFAADFLTKGLIIFKNIPKGCLRWADLWGDKEVRAGSVDPLDLRAAVVNLKSRSPKVGKVVLKAKWIL